MDEILRAVTLFTGDFPPVGYGFCNGELMTIDPSKSNPLFSLIGNMYGGDGITNFALPDLKSKVPLPGLNYIICTNGIYPSRW